MRNIQKIGPFIVYILAFIPVLIWFPYSSWGSYSATFRSLGQVTALTGVILFSINFIMSARFRILESLFFGLNRVFLEHHKIGAYAFILLLFHPTFILAQYLTFSISAAASILVPSFDNLSNSYGLIALITMTVLLILTFYIKMHYETWKATHQYLGLALIFAFLHVLITPSTITTVLILRYYVLGFVIAGLLSFFYRMVIKYFRLTSIPYIVHEINIKDSLVEIIMEPKNKKIIFTAGQFVFISVDKLGIRRESHPFSITSAPDEKYLSIVSKAVGDYTETLRLITKDTQIFVEGAYGRFSFEYFKNKNQIWIGGGIGITPFMSMLKTINNDYSVQFYYLVGDKSEAIFDDKIKRIVSVKRNIKYHSHISKNSGHLNAKKISEHMVNFKDHEVFICGPVPMMNSLKKQFKELGVKSSHIHTEEFALD